MTKVKLPWAFIAYVLFYLFASAFVGYLLVPGTLWTMFVAGITSVYGWILLTAVFVATALTYVKPGLDPDSFRDG